MLVMPLRSGLVKPGDSLIDAFSKALDRNHTKLKNDDIIAISSKIVGISEKRVRGLDQVRVTRPASRLARRLRLTPAFAQAVMDEADIVLDGVPGAILAVKDGDAAPNAGVDRKNAPKNSVVLWPRKPNLSARVFRSAVKRRFGKTVGVVIVDSRVTPLRLGTIGFALGSAGFQPIEDVRRSEDLSGRQIKMTFRAVADGIAGTAQLVMGEAAEKKPFAIIRGLTLRRDERADSSNAKLSWRSCLFMSQIMPLYGNPRATGKGMCRSD